MLKNRLYREETSDQQSYYLAVKAFRRDPNQDFLRLKSQIGIEAASLYAGMYFSNQTVFKRLRRELDLHEQEFNALNSQFDILIVLPPQRFFKKSTLQLIYQKSSRLAMSVGFEHVTHVQLNSNNALEGARRLTQFVEQRRKRQRKLILVSYSFGSAFVRIMLDHLDQKEAAIIQGWLNLSGLIFGSPRFHCSDRVTFYQKINRDTRSFSCEQRYFHSNFASHSVKVIHMLGIKNASSMTRQELRERDYLRAWGPNDGLVPFSPYQKVSEPVFVLPNQGHLIDVSQIGSTYVRILSSMVSTIPVSHPIKKLPETASKKPLNI